MLHMHVLSIPLQLQLGPGWRCCGMELCTVHITDGHDRVHPVVQQHPGAFQAHLAWMEQGVPH